MVKIAHARISEKGTIEGVAGDQTGHEVEISDWYSGGWVTVYRPNSSIDAAVIANTAVSAANNSCIGYSQEDRTSLYIEGQKYGFNLDKISTLCNTDCSALVSVCVNAAGIPVSKDMTTYNEDIVLMGTGKFTRLNAARYLTSPDLLQVGDILRKKGHTAIVVTNGRDAFNAGEKVTNHTPVYADFINKELAGKYEALTDAYMREGGAVTYRAMCVIYEENPAYCYGYYSVDSRGVKWLLCEYALNHINYTGFISEKCLKRVGDI